MAGRMIGRLNHVAIAVPDLDAATATYRDTLGAKVTQPVEQTAHGVTVVFVDLGNTRIELISPLGSNSPISNFLEKHPEGGIHHVCYEVDDIAVARDRLVGSRARIGEWRARDRGPWQASPVPTPKRFLRDTHRARTGLINDRG